MDPNDQNGQNPGMPQDDGNMGGQQAPAPEPESPVSSPEPTPEPGTTPEEAPVGGMGEVPPPPPVVEEQGDGTTVPGTDPNPAA